ncbi:MAG: GAF domain-containing protein [Gammaproteobacteria bacterium]|nr:GAF domain-containing protein [Gammaproteobacteria bacterium]
MAALYRYDVLDTQPESAYDHIVELVADHFEAPTALISFVEENRQWFKARKGFAWKETTLDDSFCIHTIQTPDVMVVEDARKDPRFADNPKVRDEPGIRSMPGCPSSLQTGIRWARCA